jgi:hypothetical protein
MDDQIEPRRSPRPRRQSAVIEALGENTSTTHTSTDPVLAQKLSTSHIKYLAAIAAATAGWLWLIARILMWSTAL